MKAKAPRACSIAGSARRPPVRVPVDRVAAVLTLYRERYGGFTARHFHDKLCQHHGFALSYTWTKLRLQQAGLIGKAERRPGRRTARSGRGDRCAG